MSAMRTELEDSARKVFPDWESTRDADAAWSQIAELGWFMAGVPEDLGGLGLDRTDMAVIFTELGRALVPGAAIAQFLCIEALVGARDFDGRIDLLESAMAGERMTAALCDGEAVPDADKAAHMLVRSDNEIALVSLDGAVIDRFETWDESRRLFTVTPATNADRIVLASGADAKSLSDRLDGLLALALAGDALGGSAAVLAMSIEYLKTRNQFDRPLAMFQALKHRAADLQAAIVTAEALYTGQAGKTDANKLGALKAHCCEVYKDVAEEAVQFHGGIGLTVEYPVHLFLKRAFLNRELGGNADRWNERTGRTLMDRPAA